MKVKPFATGKSLTFYIARVITRRRNGRCRGISALGGGGGGGDGRGCIMQRLFEVGALAVFFSCCVPALLFLSASLSGGERATPRPPANYVAGEMLLARYSAAAAREDRREADIPRDTKGNVSRRSGLIIRFHEADERRATIVSSRGNTRTMHGRSFTLLPR